VNALERLGDRLERINVAVGRAIAWLTLAMVLVTVVIVIQRYVFDTGFIWLQESLTWMHGAVFMLGAAYTLARDEHVRVDVFYRAMSERRRAVVNLAGVILFILPLSALVFYEALPYVQRSWAIREVSRDTGGLPYPAIPLMKSILLVLPGGLVMQGIALALRSVVELRRH